MDEHAPPSSSPHAFPVRLPIYVWGCFQFACFLYILILLLGVMDRGDPRPDWQGFLFFVYGSGAGMAALLGSLMGVFIQPGLENDPGRFIGKLMIRLGLQCGFFEIVGIFGMMAKGAGLHRTLSLAFVFASLLLIASLLPGVLAGVARYEDLLAGGDGAPPESETPPSS